MKHLNALSYLRKSLICTLFTNTWIQIKFKYVFFDSVNCIYIYIIYITVYLLELILEVVLFKMKCRKICANYITTGGSHHILCFLLKNGPFTLVSNSEHKNIQLIFDPIRSYVVVDFFNRICTWDVLHVTQLCTIYKKKERR